MPVGELQAGFKRHQTWLEQLVDDAPDAGRLVNREVLRQHVSKAALGITDGGYSIWRLRNTLSLMLWLRDRAALQQQPVAYIDPLVTRR
jgi:hypothetical protein